MTGRVPTTANVNVIPTIDGLGNIIMPDETLTDYSYIPIPKQRGNDFNPNVNVTQRNMAYHGDQIGNYGVLNDNPYAIDSYYGYK